MSIQRLTFSYQNAQIGIRGVSSARLQINKPQSQLNIQNGKVQLEISSRMPRFQGNRRQVNNESGLMDHLTFAKQFRDKGNQQALRAARDYAADGNFIANPKIPGDKSIPMLAANKMRRVLGPRDKNIGLMPKSIPSLNWDKGDFQINATRQNVSVNWQGRNTVSVSVDANFPVEVNLTRRASVQTTGSVPAVSKAVYNDFNARAVTKTTYGTYIDRTV